jgi:hypothetical protein
VAIKPRAVLCGKPGGIGMSFIPSGGALIYIERGMTQSWIFTWNNTGWQGNTLIQPMPLNYPASMAFAQGNVYLNTDDTYSFSFSVTNNTPSPIYFNLEASSS